MQAFCVIMPMGFDGLPLFTPEQRFGNDGMGWGPLLVEDFSLYLKLMGNELKANRESRRAWRNRHVEHQASTLGAECHLVGNLEDDSKGRFFSFRGRGIPSLSSESPSPSWKYLPNSKPPLSIAQFRESIVADCQGNNHLNATRELTSGELEASV